MFDSSFGRELRNGLLMIGVLLFVLGMAAGKGCTYVAQHWAIRVEEKKP